MFWKINFGMNKTAISSVNSYAKPVTVYDVIRTEIQKQPPEVFSKKKGFLEMSKNSQENTCARDSFLIKL